MRDGDRNSLFFSLVYLKTFPQLRKLHYIAFNVRILVNDALKSQAKPTPDRVSGVPWDLEPRIAVLARASSDLAAAGVTARMYSC
jgi:hypothetical protein